MAKIKAVHPGEILKEEFLSPLNLSINRLALDLRVPPPRIYAIVRSGRAITPDTALRLARYFGTTPEFWLNLQTNYELEITRQKEIRKIERDVHPMEVAEAAEARA